MYTKEYTDRNEVNGIMHLTRKTIARGMGKLVYADNYIDRDKACVEQFMARLYDPDVVIHVTKIETKKMQRGFVFGDKEETKRLELMAQKFKFVA
ncbi:MAG: hypothetical protein Q7S56_04075 [Nanoarchaeota archaeon]|nr:hypothetical protein [Nanoarchaeota archaeon]